MADNKTISGKKVLIKDINGHCLFPITHASLIVIDDKHTLVNIITDLQTRLARIESLIDNSNNNSSYIGMILLMTILSLIFSTKLELKLNNILNVYILA